KNLKEPDRSTILSHHSQFHYSLAGGLAAPKKLECNEVSPVNCEQSEHSQRRRPGVHRRKHPPAAKPGGGQYDSYQDEHLNEMVNARRQKPIADVRKNIMEFDPLGRLNY